MSVSLDGFLYKNDKYKLEDRIMRSYGILKKTLL